MKSHITEEQLKELNGEERVTLIEWFDKKDYFPHYSGIQLMLESYDQMMAGCISISLMIDSLQEYLKKKKDDWGIHAGKYGFVFSTAKGSLSQSPPVGKGLGKELVDVLWEAMKEALS